MNINRPGNDNGQLSAVLGAISDGVFLLDAEWRVTYLNRAAQEASLWSAAPTIGDVLWDSPGVAETDMANAFRKAMEDGVSTTACERQKGTDTWFETTAYPIESGLAVIVRDVTEREQHTRRLQKQEAVLASQASLLDTANEAIIVRDLDSAILYWNHAATRTYGWTRDEVAGKLARDILYAIPHDFNTALAHTLENGHWTGELRQVTKAGTRIVVDSSWTLVSGENGEPSSVLSVNTDVTQKRREQQLALRTERMESLGTLASGIAHDLNNVLTPIMMGAQVLAAEEKDPERLEILSSLQAAAKRGSDMISQVLSFATGATGRRDSIDIAEILTEVTDLVRDSVHDTTLVVEVDDDLWSILGDATQLVQVVLNLISNSRDAMPSGGKVTIRARNEALADAYSSISHLAPPGPYVVVEVEDEGEGIPPDALTKIFDPFFTSKKPGDGTGLGLATSLAVVRGHGGFMQAYSEVGRGSLIRIHLPATGERVHSDPDSPTPVQSELPQGSGELVLVVDDEAAIRQMTSKVLVANGYTTAVASNGAEAIAFVESGNDPVALVLTDMAMPVMDGAATAAYLLEFHPHIPVIAASGLNANGGVARAASSGVQSFLAKPYTTMQLLEAVADALGVKEDPQ